MRKLVSFDDVEKYLKQGKTLYFDLDDGRCETHLSENGELVIEMWDRDVNDDDEDVCKFKSIEQLRNLQQEYDLTFYTMDEG